MTTKFAALLLVLSAAPAVANAQATYNDPADIARYNLAAGFNYLRANAPPANCHCFGAEGGFVSAGITVKPWLTGVVEVTGSHASNISTLGQNLNLLTYTAGPRIVLRGSRFSPFAQALFGGAHGSDSYFPRSNSFTTSASSFAYSAGGGLDIHLNHRFDVRAAHVQYLQTFFPNGTNDTQHHLQIGAGIVVKFGNRLWQPDPGNQRSRADKALRAPAPVQAARAVESAPAPPPAEPVSAPARAATQERSLDDTTFHTEIPDVLFDYDSYAIRPDGQAAVVKASAYLVQHPEIRVQIGGYSDERGSAEYNIALSAKRAEAARDALVAQGVRPEQLTTRSFGKEIQICTAEQESCYQLNRRAAFNPQP